MEPITTLTGAAVVGAVGGLVKTLEKVSDVKTKTDYGKVIRNVVFGGVSGIVASEYLGVKTLIELGVSGYFGEKLVLSVARILGKKLPAVQPLAK